MHLLAEALVEVSAVAQAGERDGEPQEEVETFRASSSSVSTSRPVPDSDLLEALVDLDAATFGFMLICVVV